MGLHWVSRLLIAAVTMMSTPVSAQPAAKNPIVVDVAKTKALRDIGIAFELHHAGNVEHFANKCYNYGDGGHPVSISDAFLARYTAKGFTLQSVCLGLMSEARFHPETGRRLPTYIVADTVELKKAAKGRDPKTMTEKQLNECCSEGFNSPELPLVIPDCFKDGAPYSDCNWRYGLTTGVKLTPDSTTRFRTFGLTLERGMARLLAGEIKGCRADDGYWPCERRPIETTESGWLQAEHGQIISAIETHLDPQMLPKALIRSTAATFIDVSPVFRRGFGYALNASGDAGPSVSAYTVRASLGEVEPVSQIDLQKLMKDYED